MVEIKNPVEDAVGAPRAVPRAEVCPRPAPESAPPAEVTSTRLSNEARQAVAAADSGGEDAFDGERTAERGRESIRVFLFQLYQRLGYSRSEATVKVEKMTGAAGFQLSRQVAAAIGDVGRSASPPAPKSVSVSLRVSELELDTRELPPPPSLSVHSISGRLEFVGDSGTLLSAEPIRLTAGAAAEAPVVPPSESSAPSLDAWRHQRSEDAEVPAGQALGELFGAENVYRTDTADVFVVRTDTVLAVDRFDLPRTDTAGEAAADSASADRGESDAADDPDLNITA